MKKFIIALLVVLMASPALCAFVATTEGRTKLGSEYMIYGAYTGLASTASTIESGFGVIKAYGVDTLYTTSMALTTTDATYPYPGTKIVIASPVKGKLVCRTGSSALTSNGRFFIIGH